MVISVTSSDILTSEQLNSHIKIYAGPGAGKTHFLVENVKNIVITNALVAQSSARKVLCITYTNAAVDEISKRLDRFRGSVEVYTIHSFIIEHIIKPFQIDLKRTMLEDFGIAVDTKGRITSQVEGLGILHGINKEDIFKFVLATTEEDLQLTYSKKTMGEIEVDNVAYLATGKVQIKASDKILKLHVLPIKQYVWDKVKKLTHNEILYFGYRILQQNPTALYSTRVKFPFVFVDEFQDTNPLQAMLIKLIGAKSTVIGIIGDIAQSIYSFQGAKLSQFANFTVSGGRSLSEFVINGNRRSTANIVNLCNYFRKSDVTVVQQSIREYLNFTPEERLTVEQKKIHIISGDTENAKTTISNIIADGGVVLTRSWAAAFSYIQNITKEQEQCLRRIYNAYFTSPIDIRSEITEYNNVTWVRAFKLIFRLWNGHRTGTLSEILLALSLYSDFDKKKISPKIIYQLKRILGEVFASLSKDALMINIISSFSTKLSEDAYSDFSLLVFGQGFVIPIFDEEDKDEVKTNVALLNWDTSYKLFNEVFSENSHYMTVHQAKGREWKKVVVSLEPNIRKDRDNTSLSKTFANPQLLLEEPADEFTRMYYVACSRAAEDLYIHLKNATDVTALKNAIDSFNQDAENGIINYEII